MSNLNDLYKEFFVKTTNCGLALPAEIEEIAQQIFRLQSSPSATYINKKQDEFAGIH